MGKAKLHMPPRTLPITPPIGKDETMTTLGTGKYTYDLVQDWPKLPLGESLGIVGTVAADSQDRIYAFQRQDPLTWITRLSILPATTPRAVA